MLARCWRSAARRTTGPLTTSWTGTRLGTFARLASIRSTRRRAASMARPGEAREFAPQRLDLRGAVETEEAPEILGRMLLERLRPLDAQQCHQEQRDHGRAESVEGG